MFLTWCLLGCIALNGLLSTNGAKIFIKDDFIVHDLALSTPKIKRWAGSITHCAILCEHEHDCVNYMYQKDNERCKLYIKTTPYLKINADKGNLEKMMTFRIKNDGKQACEESGYFYNRNRGLCWRYTLANSKFSDAVRACKAVGARMIMHINNDDAVYINRIHRENGISGGWFIGMTDKAKEGEWRWLDNTWSNIKFPKGGDNNFDGAHKGKGADCAIVHQTKNVLFDVYCGSKYSFVCERIDLL